MNWSGYNWSRIASGDSLSMHFGCAPRANWRNNRSIRQFQRLLSACRYRNSIHVWLFCCIVLWQESSRRTSRMNNIKSWPSSQNAYGSLSIHEWIRSCHTLSSRQQSFSVITGGCWARELAVRGREVACRAGWCPCRAWDQPDIRKNPARLQWASIRVSPRYTSNNLAEIWRGIAWIIQRNEPALVSPWRTPAECEVNAKRSSESIATFLIAFFSKGSMDRCIDRGGAGGALHSSHTHIGTDDKTD